VKYFRGGNMIRRTAILFFLILLTTCLFSSVVHAWDVSYEGDVLPNASALGSLAWGTFGGLGNLAGTSSDGSLLHLVDSGNLCPLFCREGTGMSAGMPVTVEARVRALAAANPVHSQEYAVGLEASAYGGSAVIGLWPDKVGTHYGAGVEQWTYYPVDLTQFRTFRIAVDTGAHYYRVWMDGEEIFAGPLWQSTLFGVHFGSSHYTGEATSDSYWDYVRYSKEYLPVPEPSALMALAGGLGALGLPILRRKVK
jgi:hypothetical protein